MILDIILLIPIVYGLIRGIFRGLVGELTAIVAVVAGVVCAKLFAPEVADVLTGIFTWGKQVCELLAYVLIFAVVTLGLHLLGNLLARMLSAIALGWLNRLAGGLFGALKWALVVSVVLNSFNLLEEYIQIIKPEAKKESVIYKPVERLASVTWNAIQEIK